MVNCGRLSEEPPSSFVFCVDLTLISDRSLNVTLEFPSLEIAHAAISWTSQLVILSQNT
jgi:hypothetical protein